MKKSLLNFSMSFLSCIILGIIISLILAILKTNNALTPNAANICLTSLTILLFFLFGFIFSYRQKKRGIINSLFLIALYLVVYFILKSLNVYESPKYMIYARSGAILIGSLFGVNLATKNDQKG